VFVNLQFR